MSSLLLSAFVGDLAPKILGFGLEKAVQAMFKKRLDEARDILIEEIRKGEKDLYEASDVDEVVAIVYRYMRAAQEGTAWVNLRLLARIIAGQKASGALKANDFLYYADIIASLRHEEIIFLGTACRINRESKEDLPIEKKNSYLMDRAKDELVPSIFPKLIDMYATTGALTRTGLIIVSSAGFGGATWSTTPLFDKFCALASFEAIAETEKSKAS